MKVKTLCGTVCVCDPILGNVCDRDKSVLHQTHTDAILIGTFTFYYLDSGNVSDFVAEEKREGGFRAKKPVASNLVKEIGWLAKRLCLLANLACLNVI